MAEVLPAADLNSNGNIVAADGVGESVNFKDTFKTALATSEPPAVDGANPNRHSQPRITKNNNQDFPNNDQYQAEGGQKVPN